MGYKVTEPKAMKPSVFYVAAAAGDLRSYGLTVGLELMILILQKQKVKLNLLAML